MGTYWTLIALGSLIGLVGYIWLTIVGFKRSTLWGLLILLLSPFSAIIFAATNWREARIAFLVYAASFLMIFGTAYSFYNKFSPLLQQVEARVQNGELSQKQAKALLAYAVLNGQTTLPEPKQKEGVDSKTPADTAQEDTGNSNDKNSAVKTEGNTKPADAGSQPTEKPAAVKSKPTPVPIPDLSKVKPDPLAQKKLKLPPKTIFISMSRISHYVGRYFIIKLKNGEERRGLLTKVTASRLYLIRKLYGGDLKFSVHKYEVKSLHLLRNPPKER